jgi:hypothetical protein
MSESRQLPEPCQTQLETYREIQELDGAPLLAVHLHKAKFGQRKALEEYRSGEPVSGFLPSEVYDRSEKMVKARGENTERISVEDAWKAVAEGETWVGSLPVQMHRKQQGVYLRGFPYLIGFKDSEPRVVLNKILPNDSGNMDRFYANEWARPWVIAEILDATGFNTGNLTVATMKAKEKDEGTDEDAVLNYLYGNARENVYALLDFREELDVEITPWNPVEPDIPHESEYVRTQLIGYESEFSLYDRLGHGDSIREVVDVFQGNRDPKGTPPDRGLSLRYALQDKE